MNAILWSFIEELEGASVLQGYVPTKDGEPLEKSGVTVASGVDVGQMSALDLRTLGLRPEIVQKLLPYLGLRRHAAMAQLASLPLTLTGDEADELDMAVRKRFVRGLALRYDAAISERKVPRWPMFEELPAEAQTCIASVAFQYGQDLARRCPKFWAAACRQDWKAVVAELKAFNDSYPTRRKKEAALLSRVVHLFPDAETDGA
jgi:hypothetical protein